MPRVCAKYRPTAHPVMDYCCASVEPAMGCDAGPTLNRIWCVGLHPQYEVHHGQVLNECWPAPAMVVEEIHVGDIF